MYLLNFRHEQLETLIDFPRTPTSFETVDPNVQPNLGITFTLLRVNSLNRVSRWPSKGHVIKFNVPCVTIPHYQHCITVMTGSITVMTGSITVMTGSM